MTLRVVPTVPTATPCQGCSRRAVLQGFAMTAAGVLAGCQDDGGPAPAGTNAVATMCGANLCVELDDPQNATLTMVDGAMTVRAPKDTLVLVRTSTTAIQAMSNLCTHAGCAVSYDRIGKVFNCPCHGSRYSLTGTVLRGPAPSPLKQYATQLDPDMNVLTILL